MTASRRKQCKAPDKRSLKARNAAVRIEKAPIRTIKKKVAVVGRAIPTAVYGMNWASPSLTAARNSAQALSNVSGEQVVK